MGIGDNFSSHLRQLPQTRNAYGPLGQCAPHASACITDLMPALHAAPTAFVRSPGTLLVYLAQLIRGTLRDHAHVVLLMDVRELTPASKAPERTRREAKRKDPTGEGEVCDCDWYQRRLCRHTRAAVARITREHDAATCSGVVARSVGALRADAMDAPMSLHDILRVPHAYDELVRFIIRRLPACVVTGTEVPCVFFDGVPLCDRAPGEFDACALQLARASGHESGEPCFVPFAGVCHRYGEADVAVVPWIYRLARSTHIERVCVVVCDGDVLLITLMHAWPLRHQARVYYAMERTPVRARNLDEDARKWTRPVKLVRGGGPGAPVPVVSAGSASGRGRKRKRSQQDDGPRWPYVDVHAMARGVMTLFGGYASPAMVPESLDNWADSDSETADVTEHGGLCEDALASFVLLCLLGGCDFQPKLRMISTWHIVEQCAPLPLLVSQRRVYEGPLRDLVRRVLARRLHGKRSATAVRVSRTSMDDVRAMASDKNLRYQPPSATELSGALARWSWTVRYWMGCDGRDSGSAPCNGGVRACAECARSLCGWRRVTAHLPEPYDVIWTDTLCECASRVRQAHENSSEAACSRDATTDS